MPPDETPNSGSISGSSGGTPSPSGSPAAATTGSQGTQSPGTSPSGSAPESPSTGGESLDFETIFSGPSEAPTDLGLTETPSQPQTAAPAAPPAAPPAPPPQQQTQPPQQAPAQAPPQQPQAPQPSAADVQGVDRYDPAQLAQVLTQNEAELVNVLSSQVLALSPQEVEALETNVVEAIPRLMARTLVQAQKSALHQMANILPVAIQRHIDVMRQAGNAEQNFYKAWPMLNRQKHGNLVWEYASMFRQRYPQATLQDLVRHVGPMVMAAARIPIGSAPAAAPGRTNGRSPPPSPFVPAGGGGPVPGGQPRELQPWEAMFTNQE